MRKTLLAATATVAAMVLPAASASAMAAPAASAPALAATTDVLTLTAVGGTNMAAGGLLQSRLKKDTSLTFSFSISGVSVTITCTTSFVTLRDKTNPVAPGAARLSLNKWTAKNCTAVTNPPGLVTSVDSVTFATTDPTRISDATGHPVTVTGVAGPPPTPAVTFTVESAIGPVTCTYSATKLSGTFSNTGSVTKFSNQPFPNLQPGSNSNCPTSGLKFSANYGPLKDLSVTTATGSHPSVFVN